MELPYPEFVNYFKTCQGSGVLVSKGDMNGKLRFSFTCSNDTSYLQFKDILGRRTLYVQLFSNEINIWDMLKNRRFQPTEIQGRLPVLKFWEPSDITQILWGKIPTIKIQETNQRSRFDHDSTMVSFQTINTAYGALVNDAQINLGGSNSSVVITITKREYKLFNEKLVRNIPTNIPWN
ncbi:hypothetical protein ACFL46_02975 [Candidatus Neomarinimicrobiota bacterium]